MGCRQAQAWRRQQLHAHMPLIAKAAVDTTRSAQSAAEGRMGGQRLLIREVGGRGRVICRLEHTRELG